MNGKKRNDKAISSILALFVVFIAIYTYASHSQSEELTDVSPAITETTTGELDVPYRSKTETTEIRPSEKVKGLEIPIYTPSRGGQIIRHIGYTVQYDADYKTPQWVAWELTANETYGTFGRESSFKPDPDVRGAKAYHKDYSNSGYDRGHMAPAADMKWNEQAMAESFYTSNICPQNRNLNRGDWKDLEELAREWAVKYGAVSIAAGPIYRSKSPKRIGQNRVAVPDAFFKVLLVNYPAAPRAYGFVFENSSGNRPLRYYQKTVDEVENITGMDFFSALPDDIEEHIEAVKPRL